MATPYMYGRPVRARPRTEITTDRAGEDHAAPGGGDGFDDRVVRVLALGERGAEARQDEQRVVDADADPDQARDRRRPVGDVDDVGEQHDQAAGGDAEAEEGDQERQAGGDHRAEGDQQHDRGAEEPEPLRAGRLLRGVDRIPAELDLRARRGCSARRRRSASRRPPWGRPSRRPSTGAWSTRSCRPARPGPPSAWRRDRPAGPWRGRRRRAASRRRSGRRPGPSRRRRSPGRSSRRSAPRSARSRPWTPTPACCSRRCTRRPARSRRR